MSDNACQATGRQLCKKLSLKLRIKCCDRLLSNRHSIEERLCVYRALNECILSGPGSIGIIDWSDVRRDGSQHLLRAAAIAHGRAFVVYEEVHAEKHLGSPHVHRQFLINLRAGARQQDSKTGGQKTGGRNGHGLGRSW